MRVKKGRRQRATPNKTSSRHTHEQAQKAANTDKPRQSGATTITLPDLTFTLIVGDARETLPNWQSKADAWFLDGFSPAKNPEMWGEALLAEVGAHTAPDGTVATYTAAGFVRRGLEAGGFEVERVSGFGRKRHMTAGRLKPQPSASTCSPTPAK